MATEPTSPTTILVVEDEPAIRRGLCDVLAFHGYQPEGIERGDDGLDYALAHDVSLLLLDIMLPGLDGFAVCEQLRAAKPDLPILMLTARGSEEDILRGFRCGADDYVTKPFSVSELVARTGALLRRAGALHDGNAPAVAPPNEGLEIFSFGDWRIDPRQLVATRGSEKLELTRRDSEILALFFEEAGRIVSRRRLLREIWGYPNPDRVETRSVDMHIAKLRKKLSARDGELISTVRGEGYRFVG
jgi:DNA-binding response OmpR family regulator